MTVRVIRNFRINTGSKRIYCEMEPVNALSEGSFLVGTISSWNDSVGAIASSASMNSLNGFVWVGADIFPENPDRFAMISASKCAFGTELPLLEVLLSVGSAVSTMSENLSGVARSQRSAMNTSVSPDRRMSGPAVISPSFVLRSSPRVVPTAAPWRWRDASALCTTLPVQVAFPSQKFIFPSNDPSLAFLWVSVSVTPWAGEAIVRSSSLNLSPSCLTVAIIFATCFRSLMIEILILQSPFSVLSEENENALTHDEIEREKWSLSSWRIICASPPSFATMLIERETYFGFFGS